MIPHEVAVIFDHVWRFDFTAPGFCLIDLGSGVDSHSLRRKMVLLKEQLSLFAGNDHGESDLWAVP